MMCIKFLVCLLWWWWYCCYIIVVFAVDGSTYLQPLLRQVIVIELLKRKLINGNATNTTPHNASCLATCYSCRARSTNRQCTNRIQNLCIVVPNKYTSRNNNQMLAPMAKTSTKIRIRLQSFDGRTAIIVSKISSTPNAVIVVG